MATDKQGGGGRTTFYIRGNYLRDRGLPGFSVKLAGPGARAVAGASGSGNATLLKRFSTGAIRSGLNQARRNQREGFDPFGTNPTAIQRLERELRRRG